MRGALGVRINDGTTDRIVTGFVRDYRHTKVAPGGHMSASMRLAVPRNMFTDLGPADRVYVYDKRTGRTIWEGYAENPTPTDGSSGQEYDLSAMGGMTLASDESRALVYVDSAFSEWSKVSEYAMAPSATADVTSSPTTPPVDAMVLQFTPGQPVAANALVRMQYDLRPIGFEIGAFKLTRVSGLTDANWTERVEIGPPVTHFSRTTSTTAETFTAGVNGFGFFGAGYLVVQLWRTPGGATNVATDTVWTAYSGVRVLGQHLDRTGARVSHGQADYTLASRVAEDLLARVLKQCDPTTAMIDTSTFQVDQLAYWDGATAARVLDDLARFEPDFLWEILESNAAGKHRFNYRKWPTTPRYEISVKDGYSAPGGESDLCNRVTVYWTDGFGRKQATVVTQSVDALGGDPATPGFSGRIRDAEPVNLPDGFGSAANATRIGQQELAAKANPPKAATATVRHEILDMLTGNMVMPWEIEPGYLVRVRETGDDLRLTEVEYVDADGAASLTLGEPTLTLEQRVARLSRRQ